jgi:hypothetical protein
MPSLKAVSRRRVYVGRLIVAAAAVVFYFLCELPAQAAIFSI